jgi:hypothetical protein
VTLTMQEADTATGLTYTRWDLALVGESVDERGDSAHAFAAQASHDVRRCGYDSETSQLNVAGHIILSDNIAEELAPLAGRRIVLDATTLGFAEIFLICRALRDLCTDVSVVYVEPLEYRARTRTELMHRREFELSAEVLGYQAIPGAISLLSSYRQSRVVFFVGYEERRLDRALADFELNPANCSVVFGVPAFRPGWEMDSFANNVRVMKERGIRGDIYYCGAESPAGAIDVLLEVKRELQLGQKLFVAPIGTKPNGVGVALYAAVDPSIGILYDHPKRKSRRSSNVGHWHLYNAVIEC